MTEQSDVASGPVPVRWSELMLEEALATIALTIVVASVAWGVLTRYILATPASWAGELASIAFAWAVFLGAAAAFRRNGHIAIDSLVAMVPAGLGRALQLAAAAVTFATLLAVTGLALRFTLSTTDAPTTVLRWPQAVVYAAAAVGFGLMTLRHAAATYDNLFNKAASK